MLSVQPMRRYINRANIVLLTPSIFKPLYRHLNDKEGKRETII